jgi:hypothetical protein
LNDVHVSGGSVVVGFQPFEFEEATDKPAGITKVLVIENRCAEPLADIGETTVALVCGVTAENRVSFWPEG